MCSYYESLAFLSEKLSLQEFYKDLNRKNIFNFLPLCSLQKWSGKLTQTIGTFEKLEK